MVLALKENRTNQMNFSYPWPVRPIYHSKPTSISKNQELLNFNGFMKIILSMRPFTDKIRIMFKTIRHSN